MNAMAWTGLADGSWTTWLPDGVPGPGAIVVGFLAAVLLAGTSVRRRRRRLDPLRWFDSRQRAAARHLAGDRCEYGDRLAPWRRCRAPHAETDHFFPHSRGGATVQANAVAACRWHNQAKGARMPSGLTRWLIGRRRANYFPAGTVRRPGQWWHPRLDRYAVRPTRSRRPAPIVTKEW